MSLIFQENWFPIQKNDQKINMKISSANKLSKTPKIYRREFIGETKKPMLMVVNLRKE